jgi:hypothetical protein
MQRPPTRINILEKTQFGIPLRALGILVVSALVAGVAFFGLFHFGLVLSATVTLLTVGLGLGLAFGEIDGLKPEAWLLQLLDFRRRRRYMVKGALPQTEQPVTLANAEPAPAPKPMPRPARTRSIKLPRQEQAVAAVPMPSFLWVSGSILCAGTLLSLTVYMLNGGAERLATMVQLASHGL